MLDLSQQWIDGIDEHLQRVATIKTLGATYKLGDVYLLELSNTRIECNSMGEPAKYQVVRISPMGIVYLQKLSSTGVPTGNLSIPPEMDFIKYARVWPTLDDSCRLVQDPDQLNAIMLQQEYDPMKNHNEKLKLQYEINKHNKSILVPTGFYDVKTYVTFLKSLKPGDQIWTSLETQYIVSKPAEKCNGKWTITLIDVNQQEVKRSLNSFGHKRLYKNKPRSFAKEVGQ